GRCWPSGRGRRRCRRPRESTVRSRRGAPRVCALQGRPSVPFCTRRMPLLTGCCAGVVVLVAWNPIGFDVAGVVVSDSHGESRGGSGGLYVRFLPLSGFCRLIIPSSHVWRMLG